MATPSPDTAASLVFDAALDGPAWPGPLGGSGFTFGEAWVGPLGLVDVLETHLGLGGRFDGPLERACRLAAQLRERSGFWRWSFAVDPVATARRLLRYRDDLRVWGWTANAGDGLEAGRGVERRWSCVPGACFRVRGAAQEDDAAGSSRKPWLSYPDASVAYSSNSAAGIGRSRRQVMAIGRSPVWLWYLTGPRKA
jgi:hypothetical protein